jgi:hypothetical protein
VSLDPIPTLDLLWFALAQTAFLVALAVIVKVKP